MTGKRAEITPILVDMFDNGDEYVVAIRPHGMKAFEITMGDYDDAHLLMELIQRSRGIALASPA
jgi:hypothetical protein